MSEEIFSNSNESSEENKTGSWRTFRAIIMKDKCTGCTICSNVCPDGCIDMIQRNDPTSKFPLLAKINYDFCKGCLVCMNECPFKAITSEKEGQTEVSRTEIRRN